ncbi:MAG TPA: rod shape-determining protein MreC [Micropepsaceae bacterium]|nr:rod shape-determining protein MreC [Micropepsaceae bacterium]HRK71354.1 rod shape-determining protein MreC [Micropepsaceae bacterium]
MNDRRRRGGGFRAPVELLSHRVALVLLSLVAAGFLLLGRADSALFEGVRKWFSDTSAPVLEALATPLRWAEEQVNAFTDIFTVYEENERLREENARLLEWKNAALEMEARIKRYEALLNMQIAPESSFVTAEVIGDTRGPFVRALIVNAGITDGVTKGQAVIDANGLIGRVVEAGNSSSRVLLLTDLSSRIPVVIEPYGVRAILAGDNSEYPRIEFLPPGVTLSTGDRIVTSGDGGVFPPGIAVGVASVGDDPGDVRVIMYSTGANAQLVRIIDYNFPTGVDAPALVSNEAGEAVLNPQPAN